jgi:dephospho-CoA kinase
MDNTVTIPGYKVFLAPDGSRPAVAVAFLDIEPEPGAAVDGTCRAVDALELARLDARERNYDRVDVTASVEPALGPTWAYVGRADSRERFAAALVAGTCVVSREYAERLPVLPDERRPPVVELRRRDI